MSPDPAPAPNEPRLEDRPARPYAAIRAHTRADGISEVVDEAFPALFGWLAERDIAPAGAPLIRYLAMDGEDPFSDQAELELDVGVPVGEAIEAAAGERVQPGELPAGTWICVLHRGHFDGLLDASLRLKDWVEAQELDIEGTLRRPAGNIEQYLTDPTDEPDPAKWETEIAVLAAADAVAAWRARRR